MSRAYPPTHHHHQGGQHYAPEGPAWAHQSPVEMQQAGGGPRVVHVGAHQEPVTGEVVPLYPDCKDPELKRIGTQGWKDVYFIPLFLAAYLACIVVGVMEMTSGNLSSSTKSGNSTTSPATALAHFRDGALIGFGVSVVLTLLLLGMLKWNATYFIIVALVISVLIWIAVAALSFAIGAIAQGVIFLIIAAIMALWSWCVRGAIPLAAFCLKSTVETCAIYYGTWITSFVSGILCLVWFIFWACTSMKALRTTKDDTSASSGSLWISVALFFTLVFVAKVHEYVNFMTAAGVIGTRFFLSTPETMPADATSASLKRAMTTSFGTNVIAALVMALIKTLEYIFRSLAGRGGGCCAAIAACVMGCLARIAQFFNTFGLAHAALFGGSFVESSGQAIEFFERSLWGAIVNQLLLERVLALITIIVVIISAVVAYFAVGGGSIFALLGALLAAFIIVSCVTVVLTAGQTTWIILVAEFQEVFQRNDPAGYRDLMVAVNEAGDSGCA